ncbi:GH1 family beta-glucosidase [Roseateles saccharophilus]|uniref:Beta-glucosidase n=1 Tax=Roseateles saccharophilus TaxID=304 RepID=A0A4R3VFW3_ROSSA|nr:GH1 family beta-glucosidase [Roseateles saccharophilus]MDG0831186.1 beta-glucosidase [Roseateles saccharophilus]TCV04307.1 broad-specificity cellobiase [Roseateles saccharophilus]
MSSNPAPIRKDFPADFRWGVSTSSFQIEGGAREDGRGESIWDRFCAEPGRIRDGSNAEVACDHYHRWPQDLDMAKALGVNAYRFSIAWPRILPNGSTGRGPVNEAGLAFYDRLVDGMLERGLDPWATLYHWDLPQTLQEQGGWTSRDTVTAFLEYTDIVTRRLGDRVGHWITHNEPWCSCMMGYWEGVHAPGGRSLADAMQACHHVLLSHGQAVALIRRNSPDAQVGITLSLHPIAAASDSAADLAALQRHDGLRNRWFLDPLFGRGYPEDTLALLGEAAPRVEAGDLAAIAAATDFLGVNYYFPEVVQDDPDPTTGGPTRTRLVEREGVERTGFGWEVSPQGLVDLLARIQRDYAPAVIQLTENGSTFEDVLTTEGRVHDTERLSYLQRHLAALRQAMDAGVPVKGYFAWSLLDNFEWAEGYLRRFGLAHVDYATQQRRLKDSGLWYGRFLNE